MLGRAPPADRLHDVRVVADCQEVRVLDDGADARVEHEHTCEPTILVEDQKALGCRAGRSPGHPPATFQAMFQHTKLRRATETHGYYPHRVRRDDGHKLALVITMAAAVVAVGLCKLTVSIRRVVPSWRGLDHLKKTPTHD